MIGVPSWTESEETSSSRPEDTERTTKQPEGKPQSFDVAFSSPSLMIMVFGLREPELEHIICLPELSGRDKAPYEDARTIFVHRTLVKKQKAENDVISEVLVVEVQA